MEQIISISETETVIVDNNNPVTVVSGLMGPRGLMYGSRVQVYDNPSSITINVDITDTAIHTNTQDIGVLPINAPIGAPWDGQKILLKITSNNPQVFQWDSIFVGSTDFLLPISSSGNGKTDYMGFIYNPSSSQWQLIAKNFGF